MRCRGFTLIELLVVIAIIALVVGILLPALAGARNTARMGVSLSNMKQIATAHELYRVEHRDQLPIPIVFQNASGPGYAGSVMMIGGKFARSLWAPTNFDFWPGERLLNPYTNPSEVLPHPRDINPGWTIGTARPAPEAGIRERMELPNWRSPGDKVSRESLSGQDLTISQYNDRGTSYLFNNIWLTHASAVMTGDPYDAEGLRRAARWGTRIYNQIETSKLVVIFDGVGAAVYVAPVIGGQYRRTPGEYGGMDKSVMGFADGHSSYVQMRRMTGTFYGSDEGAGSMRFPGFEYSLQIDSITPR